MFAIYEGFLGNLSDIVCIFYHKVTIVLQGNIENGILMRFTVKKIKIS